MTPSDEKKIVVIHTLNRLRYDMDELFHSRKLYRMSNYDIELLVQEWGKVVSEAIQNVGEHWPNS